MHSVQSNKPEDEKNAMVNTGLISHSTPGHDFGEDKNGKGKFLA